MNKYNFLEKTYIASIIVLVSAFSIWWISWNNRNTDTIMDSFAQCLADEKIVMYGANWCSHCQNEKKQFGRSFRFVPYVECPKDPKRCLAAGIESFPTWIFPDGKKLVGEQGLENLAKESRCKLNN
ncbi:MAG: hypothetical protein HZB99_02375 [Candidatus Harrisonbacteria bacterium]|nr:hypothetical protein [Candidatus Harrisonbacteria bacterium]